MPKVDLQVSGTYFYPQVNRATQNPRSLETPVSSSIFAIDATASSASLGGGGRYMFTPTSDCFTRFVIEGVDAQATDQDVLLTAAGAPYFLTSPPSANGLSVVASGSNEGFVSVVKLA